MSKNFQLVERRERTMDRVDRALDTHWPDRKGSEYEREMEAAARELESIAAEMRREHAAPLEQSRTYRFLGSVYSDLAPALGHGMLIRAKDAYLEAERLLAGHGSALEEAKFDFNFANTLRQLDPNDSEQLADARRRLTSAREIFQKEAPQYLGAVDEALRSVAALLAVVPVAADVERNLTDMRSVQESIGTGGEATAIAERVQEIMKQGGGIDGMFGRIQGALAKLPKEFKEDPRFAEITKQLGDIMASSTETGPRDPNEAEILEALRERLASDRMAGKVAPGRPAKLDRLIDQIGGMLAGGDDFESLMGRKEELRRGAEDQFEILHYLSHGIDRPPSGSRASELVELCWRLRRFLIEAQSRPNKGARESKQALDLNKRAGELDRWIYEAGDNDEEARRVEQEELRPLALAIRRFALAPHAMIARPIWPTARASVDSSSVFYSGSRNVRRIVARIAKRLDLSLQRQTSGGGFADARWVKFQKAAICVFDLSGNDGPQRAAVSYELGIALALGKPVVIVSDTEQLPFDVDAEPVILTGESDDEEALAEALDESLVWLPYRGRLEGPVNTVNHVLATYPRPGANVTIDQTLRHIESLREELDPIAIADALQTLLGVLDEPGARMIYPAWAPAYPDPHRKRLFHVMPFRPKWAKKAVNAARAACDSVGAEYIRGDEVEDPNVIRSIWEEICRASQVLVDLTGFNSNVALEAGIAHTLGRPTMLTGRQESIMDELFPNIAKLRVYPYREPSDKRMGAALKKFLA
ncbi:MAG: DNA2/NAM7 family helicase [candidate division Zixibacteria bacterium]|nr:DNA2/NAM7 family helicase [candidate division Zixibacteria bacterium]